METFFVTHLLQEIVLDKPSNVKRHFVALAQRTLTDQLHNLGELVLLLQDLLGLVPRLCKVGRVLVVVRLQDSEIFRVRDVPVNLCSI
jgi:hypothetical protein